MALAISITPRPASCPIVITFCVSLNLCSWNSSSIIHLVSDTKYHPDFSGWAKTSYLILINIDVVTDNNLTSEGIALPSLTLHHCVTKDKVVASLSQLTNML